MDDQIPVRDKVGQKMDELKDSNRCTPIPFTPYGWMSATTRKETRSAGEKKQKREEGEKGRGKLEELRKK
jgi:hypothetical protein